MPAFVPPPLDSLEPEASDDSDNSSKQTVSALPNKDGKFTPPPLDSLEPLETPQSPSVLDGLKAYGIKLAQGTMGAGAPALSEYNPAVGDLNPIADLAQNIGATPPPDNTPSPSSSAPAISPSNPQAVVDQLTQTLNQQVPAQAQGLPVTQGAVSPTPIQGQPTDDGSAAPTPFQNQQPTSPDDAQFVATKSPLQKIEEGDIPGASGDIYEAIRRQFTPVLGPTEKQRFEESIPFGTNPDGSQQYQYKPLGDRMTREQGLMTPLVPIQKYVPSKSDGPIKAASKALFNTAAGLEESFISPGGAILAGGSVVPALGRLAAAGFSADMLANLPHQIYETFKGNTLQDKMEGFLGAVSSGLFGAAGAHHAITGGAHPIENQPAQPIIVQPESQQSPQTESPETSFAPKSAAVIAKDAKEAQILQAASNVSAELQRNNAPLSAQAIEQKAAQEVTKVQRKADAASFAPQAPISPEEVTKIAQETLDDISDRTETTADEVIQYQFLLDNLNNPAALAFHFGLKLEVPKNETTQAQPVPAIPETAGTPEDQEQTKVPEATQESATPVTNESQSVPTPPVTESAEQPPVEPETAPEAIATPKEPQQPAKPAQEDPEDVSLNNNIQNAKTGNPFQGKVFRADRGPRVEGTGTFYAVSPEHAEGFNVRGNEVNQHQVNLENPLVIDGGHSEAVRKLSNNENFNKSQESQDAYQALYTVEKSINEGDQSEVGYNDLDRAIQKFAQKQGYDGIIYRKPLYKAFGKSTDISEIVKFDSDKNKNPTNDPGLQKALDRVEKTNNQLKRSNANGDVRDIENAQKSSKATGMQLSAERRRVEGKLTPKEQKLAAQEAQARRVGRTVSTPDGDGVIIKSPAYGSVKVRLTDGTEKSYPSEKVTVKQSEKTKNEKPEEQTSGTPLVVPADSRLDGLRDEAERQSSGGGGQQLNPEAVAAKSSGVRNLVERITGGGEATSQVDFDRLENLERLGVQFRASTAGRTRVTPDENGNIVINLTPKQFISSEEDGEVTPERVARLLDEEAIHAVQYLALRDQWEKEGRQGNFIQYNKNKGRELIGEFKTALAKSSPKDRKKVESAIASAYNLYFQPYGKKGGDVEHTASLQDIDEAIQEGYGGDHIGFLLELTRMLHQERIKGHITEGTLQAFIEGIKKWIQSAYGNFRGLLDHFAENGVLSKTEAAKFMQDFAILEKGLKSRIPSTKYLDSTPYEPTIRDSADKLFAKDERQRTEGAADLNNQLQPLTQAQKRLVGENQRLAYSIADKYRNIPQSDRDDLAHEAVLALSKAARTFDTSRYGEDDDLKKPFASYAYRAITNKLNNVYRSKLKESLRSGGSLNEPMGEDGEEKIANVAAPEQIQPPSQEGLDVVRSHLAKLPDNQRKALQGISEGKNLREIGKEMGISHEYVRLLANKASAELKNKLTNQGIKSSSDIFPPSDEPTHYLTPKKGSEDEELQRSTIGRSAIEDEEGDKSSSPEFKEPDNITNLPDQGEDEESQAAAKENDDGIGAKEDEKPERSTTGISQRVYDKNNIPIEPGEGISAEEQLQRGRDLLKAGANPEKIIEHVNSGGGTSGDEMAVLRAQDEKWEQYAQKARQEADDHPDELLYHVKADKAENRAQAFKNAIKPAATEAHKVFMALQGETEIDTGNFVALKAAAEKKKGQPLSSDEIVKTRELSKTVADLEKQIADKQKELNKIGEQNVGSTLRAKKQPRPEVTLLKAQAIKAKDRFLARRKAMEGLSAGAKEDKPEKLSKEDLADATLVGADHLADGVKNFKDWSDAMVNDLGDDVKPYLKDIFKNSQDKAEKAIGSPIKGIKVPKEPLNPIWNHFRDNYLDQGKSFEESLTGTMLDKGLTRAQVLTALPGPKVKPISDELYKLQSKRRSAQNKARAWVNTQKNGKFWKALENFYNAPFAIRTVGHATGMETHAGANLYDPRKWGNYLKGWKNQYHFLFSPKGHEIAMQALESDPNFTAWKRAKLAADPNEASDQYQEENNIIGGWFGRGGSRGMDALKVFRYQEAQRLWNTWPEGMKTAEGRRQVAAIVNSATGHAEDALTKGVIGRIQFASKLQASRRTRTLVDPIKTFFHLTNKGSTPEEKQAARVRLQNGIATLSVLGTGLALNQAVLAASGSKQKINFTRPQDPDYLQFKGAGYRLEATGKLFAYPILVLRLLLAAHDSISLSENQQRKKYYGKLASDEMGSDLMMFARGALHPFISSATTIATGKDYTGSPVPWSADAGTRNHPRLTWGQYIASEFSPIAVDEGIQAARSAAIHQGGHGADTFIRGLAATAGGLTGASVRQDNQK